MTNLDGENSSDITKKDVKEKVEEETPIIEPIINLLQQLEDYSPTVSKIFRVEWRSYTNYIYR